MDHERYLKETSSLDFRHPAVAALVNEVRQGGGTLKEQAVRMFLRVRDDVRYDPYAILLVKEAFTASATLEGKKGYCVTKAILFAAGLRALGIPARLGFADVVNHLATKRLLEIMRTDVFSYHGYVELLLDGTWVKATPAFNASLCEKFGAAPLEFDGVHDAMLQPVNREGKQFMEYVRDHGTFEDFDLDAMLRAWKSEYPHLFLEAAPTPEGDFEAEAVAGRQSR